LGESRSGSLVASVPREGGVETEEARHMVVVVVRCVTRLVNCGNEWDWRGREED
jgi:hypothetical protein